MGAPVKTQVENGLSDLFDFQVQTIYARLLIPFLKFLLFQTKRNSNYKNYGNWQEFLFIWQ